MILDLDKFIATERPHWTELERRLDRLADDPYLRLSLEEWQRFHYLYERASADLGRLATFSAEPETRRYLESLVGRAYAEIHSTRKHGAKFRPVRWFLQTFPQTFRRHARAFGFSVLLTVAGCLFGGVATMIDPDSRHVTMPFGHDQMRPSERVAEEEQGRSDALAGRKTAFSAQLMTHNTKVSIFALALGLTYAVGTIVLLFYNGVILGAISVDYIGDGQGTFLAGWLLPHGSVEIPAILIAGQAGLVLGRTLIGWGDRQPLRARLRAVAPDLVTLIGGVGVLMVWAGVIEAFFSQYHEPLLPYALKIAFGLVELALLTWFLWQSGRESPAPAARPPEVTP